MQNSDIVNHSVKTWTQIEIHSFNKTYITKCRTDWNNAKQERTNRICGCGHTILKKKNFSVMCGASLSVIMLLLTKSNGKKIVRFIFFSWKTTAAVSTQQMFGGVSRLRARSWKKQWIALFLRMSHYQQVYFSRGLKTKLTPNAVLTWPKFCGVSRLCPRWCLGY